jgi:hypothetical protein
VVVYTRSDSTEKINYEEGNYTLVEDIVQMYYENNGFENWRYIYYNYTAKKGIRYVLHIHEISKCHHDVTLMEFDKLFGRLKSMLLNFDIDIELLYLYNHVYIMYKIILFQLVKLIIARKCEKNSFMQVLRSML